MSRSSRRGSIMMEFVISMPILFLLIMLTLQYAHVWMAKQMLSYAAFCAARSTLACAPGEQQKATREAAKRALAWMNIYGKRDRAYAHVDSEISASDFSDISDTSAFQNQSGRPPAVAGDVKIPGWGGVPESDSTDDRLQTKPLVVQGKYAACTVVYKFPLLIPVAGQMVSYLAKHTTGKESATYRASMGWTGEEELFDGMPFIELTETCVLPLPYSTVNLPFGAYASSL